MHNQLLIQCSDNRFVKQLLLQVFFFFQICPDNKSEMLMQLKYLTRTSHSLYCSSTGLLGSQAKLSFHSVVQKKNRFSPLSFK